MKKQIINNSLLIAILIFASLSVQAQSHKLALSITGGYVQGGFGTMATVDYKTNEFDYVQVNLQANFTQLEFQNFEIPVDLYAFQAGYFFDILRNNTRTFAIAVGAGANLGYERINNGDAQLENNLLLDIDTSKVVFGAYAGLDADIFIIPTVAINIKANEVYHANSDIGDFIPYVGLGVKLIIK